MLSPFPGMDPYLESPRLWAGFRTSFILELQSQLSQVLRPDYFIRPMIAEPAIAVENAVDLTREIRLEIRSTANRSLVAVIEVSDPSTKVDGSPAQLRFLERRRTATAPSAHRMEIDLLRAGTRIPAHPPEVKAEYHALLISGGEPHRMRLWPIPLRERLPVIGLPLLDNHRAAPIDLQAAIQRVYERGGYDLSLSYDNDPTQPLGLEDLQWIRDRIRKW